MLVTMTARLVRSHGKDEVPLPGGGRIEYTPATHGIYQGALRGTDMVVAEIEEGVAEPVELTPGTWRVYVRPRVGSAWPSFLVELTEGMPEPVDLVDLAPVLVVDGEKWSQGKPGASVTGAVDNGDQTVSFTLSDGTETDPVPIPPGPQGVGIESISDPDAESRVTVTYTDGSTSTVQAIVGADGHTPTIEWDGTALVIDGETGPDLAGAPGADSTVPGPAPEVAWDGTRLTVGGETSPDLQGPQGNPGAKGDPGNLGSTLIYGVGRPDVPSSMSTETRASVNAAPNGAEFISTDGPQGAWKWQKQGTAWRVTVGDTGWRAIPLPAPYAEGSTVRVRREGRLVYAAHGTPQQWTQWNPGIAKTSGVAVNKAWDGTNQFRPDNRTIAQIYNGDTGAVVGAVGWSTEGGGFLGLTHTVSSGMVFELQAAISQAWPTSLPGDAA